MYRFSPAFLAAYALKAGDVLTGRFALGGFSSLPTTAFLVIGNPDGTQIDAAADVVIQPTALARIGLQLISPNGQTAKLATFSKIDGAGTKLEFGYLDANLQFVVRLGLQSWRCRYNTITTATATTADSGVLGYYTQHINRAGTVAVTLSGTATHLQTSAALAQRILFVDTSGAANSTTNLITIACAGSGKLYAPGDSAGVTSITISKPYGFVEVQAFSTDKFLIKSKDNV